jgi:1-acyl-sn-glycerol-3-phosphate acyltransferase
MPSTEIRPPAEASVSRVTLPPQHPFIHHAARALLRPLLRAYFGLRAEGLDHLPQSGSYLLAPNHVTMLDWAYLSYFLPRLTRFLVHREYYDHWLLGLGLRVNGAVPVRTDRPDVGALRKARAVLAAGEALIYFPEGRISRDGQPQSAPPGVVALAAAARVPLVPVAIRGAFEAFPRWRSFPRPGRITVVFGRPLAPPPAVDRDRQRQLAQHLMAHIAALLNGVPAPPPW